MLSNDEVLGESRDDLSDFVPAVVARSADEAEQYRELLDDHDIPAIIGTDEDLPAEEDGEGARPDPIVVRGVPVMVPETLLDEASKIISDRQEFNGFSLGEDEFEDEDEDEFELGEDGFGLSETELFDDEDEFADDSP